MKNSIISIIGFLLFLIGFISLLLMATGLRLSYLAFLDSMGNLWGFVIRLIMIMTGLIMVYYSRTITNEKGTKPL